MFGRNKDEMGRTMQAENSHVPQKSARNSRASGQDHGKMDLEHIHKPVT